MPSIATRVTKLKKLYNIRCGDGAALLPSNITKIHMTFPVRQKGGYLGARQFWRHILPRLKYYNPSIPMMVSRPVDRDGECLMRIYVKRSKQGRFLPSKDITELKPSGEAKMPIRPVEYNEDWVPALPHAFPHPNVSFDEELIELPMRNLSYQHIWVRFKHKIPVTLVSNEVAMVKDHEDIEKQAKLRRGDVEGDAGKRWLEMFKKEQAYCRELEELHASDREQQAKQVEQTAIEDREVRAERRAQEIRDAPAMLVAKAEEGLEESDTHASTAATLLAAVRAAFAQRPVQNETAAAESSVA